MQKLVAVEEAKVLMNRAKDWSVWRWLLEKRRVRAAADTAVAALDDLDKSVKAVWADDLKKAYRELEAQASFAGNSRAKRQYEKAKEEARNIDPQTKLAVQQVKKADDDAYQARMDAEEKFDEAERQLSASLAREAAKMAVDSWDLRLKAIRKAEALGRRT
jgi:hypothetical protein